MAALPPIRMPVIPEISFSELSSINPLENHPLLIQQTVELVENTSQLGYSDALELLIRAQDAIDHRPLALRDAEKARNTALDALDKAQAEIRGLQNELSNMTLDRDRKHEILTNTRETLRVERENHRQCHDLIDEARRLLDLPVTRGGEPPRSSAELRAMMMELFNPDEEGHT